ncbi:hypothetical protein [Streptomyces sp. NPDC016626]|uniref:hypothetical protein n=1 Tax=Streptomyces sp. NPDC016626 TaxID=3364968 RepID=UPI0036F6F7A4
MVMVLLLAFAIVVAAVWIVAITADALIDRRIHVPERWTVHIPGQFPLYVRQDYARARKAMARAARHRTGTPED